MGEGMADTTWDTQDVLDGLIGKEGIPMPLRY